MELQQEQYWVPWAMAGVMILAMVLYAVRRNRRNKRK